MNTAYHRTFETLLQVFPDWSNELDACTTIAAGFSVGEITALIFSGSLSFEDGRALNEPFNISYNLLQF